MTMSELSDKESTEEEQLVNGDEDLRAEINFPPRYESDDVGTGRSGSRPPYDSLNAATAIGAGGSGVPQDNHDTAAAIGT
jgi:hypothetical protein